MTAVKAGFAGQEFEILTPTGSVGQEFLILVGVPEPGELMLMAIGLGLLVIATRQKHTTRAHAG